MPGPQRFQGGSWLWDTIGVFDSTHPDHRPIWNKPTATGWMALYSLNLWPSCSNWLEKTRPTRIASQIWEHFPLHRNAINHLGREDTGMWERSTALYTMLHFDDGGHMAGEDTQHVGVIPLYAIETMEPAIHQQAAGLQAPHGMGSSRTS